MQAVSISLHRVEHLPIESHQIYRRHELEARFFWRTIPRLLPVCLDGQIILARWGSMRRESSRLPPTGWTWLTTFLAGGWSPWCPELVTIPCEFARTGGVWYETPRGVRGLLVANPDAPMPWVYVLCKPSTFYFEIMTKSKAQPVLADEELPDARGDF